MGAKFTGEEIAPDEHIQPELGFNYDGKRDRWNGYDMDDHKKIFEEFQKIEAVSIKMVKLNLIVRSGI